MIKLKNDTLNNTLTVNEIISEINDDLKVMEQVKKANLLRETFDKQTGSVGFRP